MALLGIWGRRKKKNGDEAEGSEGTEAELEKNSNRPPKWSIGILNDKETDEVPGTFVHFVSLPPLICLFARHPVLSRPLLTPAAACRCAYLQVPYSCSQKPPTITSHLVCATHPLVRRPPLCRRLTATQVASIGYQKRNAQRMAKSFWNRNRRKVPMTRSIGRPGGEMLRYCR